MSLKHLLIAGGGTGGHITPAIAVGEKAEAKAAFNVSYVCTPRPVDSAMYASVESTVHVMNPPRIDKGMKIFLPFSLISSFLKARKLLKSIGADIVLGTGGYASFFTIVAAKSMGIPAAIFDSNVIPGKSNRVASRFCKVAFTGLPGGQSGLKCKTIQTGTPVTDKMKKTNSSAAKKTLGIPENKPVVLFLGGSQGASAINDLALKIKGEVSILLQAGKSDYNRVINLIGSTSNIKAEAFIDDLSLWYSAADLVVARAGGQTIAELVAFGIPAVFIPYPYAAENHQMANAKALEKIGASLCIEQKDAMASDFNWIISELLNNVEELDRMTVVLKKIMPSNPSLTMLNCLKELVT